jgi:MFS family permease
VIAARAVQGAGAAMAAPTALSLIAVTFPEGRPRNRAVAVYSAMAIVGIVAGLIAGGLLVTYGAGRRASVRRPGGRAASPDLPPRAGHRVLPGATWSRRASWP